MRFVAGALASAFAFMVGLYLGWWEYSAAAFAYLLFFATLILAVAGTVNAVKALRRREESPLAGWALVIGLLLLAPSALLACWMTFLLINMALGGGLL